MTPEFVEIWIRVAFFMATAIVAIAMIVNLTIDFFGQWAPFVLFAILSFTMISYGIACWKYEDRNR